MSNIGVVADGVGAASAAGYRNGKRAMRQQYAQHTPNQPISSGSFYHSSSNPNLHLNPNSLSLESYSVTSHESPSHSGSCSGGICYQSMGREPLPGPSVVILVRPSAEGRYANEMEAMRPVMSNLDDGRGQLPAFQQAYLQTRSGPQPSLSPTAVNNSRAGAAVVAHEDGVRVLLRRGKEGEGEGRVLNPELPPIYDSLPVDVRRDS